MCVCDFLFKYARRISFTRNTLTNRSFQLFGVYVRFFFVRFFLFFSQFKKQFFKTEGKKSSEQEIVCLFNGQDFTFISMRQHQHTMYRKNMKRKKINFFFRSFFLFLHWYRTRNKMKYIYQLKLI